MCELDWSIKRIAQLNEDLQKENDRLRADLAETRLTINDNFVLVQKLKRERDVLEAEQVMNNRWWFDHGRKIGRADRGEK